MARNQKDYSLLIVLLFVAVLIAFGVTMIGCETVQRVDPQTGETYEVDAAEQISETVAAVSPALPPPWNMIVTGAGILIGAASETLRRRTKAAAIDAIGSLSAAEDEGLVKLSGKAKSRLSSIQSPAAKALVKQAKATYVAPKTTPAQ